MTLGAVPVDVDAGDRHGADAAVRGRTSRTTRWFLPSLVSVTGAGQAVVSAALPVVQVKVTLTGADHQPPTLGRVLDSVAVMTG